jgi:hypothetical protein
MHTDSRDTLDRRLRALLAEHDAESLPLGLVIAALGQEASLGLVVVFAALNMIPAPPGTSAILGIPLVLFALQAMVGARPRLPKILSDRRIPRNVWLAMTEKLERLSGGEARMLRPRLQAMVSPMAARLLRVVIVMLAVSVMVPLPFTAMAPAFSIILIAVGLLERDGAWVIAGLIGGLIAVAILALVLFGAIKIAFLIASA